VGSAAVQIAAAMGPLPRRGPSRIWPPARSTSLIRAQLAQAVSEFITLDGIIENPGGSEDTEHGGWSFPR
jgi:hypothetical protein